MYVFKIAVAVFLKFLINDLLFKQIKWLRTPEREHPIIFKDRMVLRDEKRRKKAK